MKKVFYLIVLFGIFTSCNLDNRQYNNQLKNLDTQLEHNPEMVWDSLKKMKVNKLNEAQLAYYHLLNASATDKNLVQLENDSTLLIALEYFTDQEDYYNIARCQYYLGKYKHKQEQTKRAFELFKKAEQNANQSDQNTDHLLGLIYYQQGLILKQEYNFAESPEIFQKSYEKFVRSTDTISAVYSLKMKALMKILAKDYATAKEILNQSINLINNDKQDPKIILAQNSNLLALSYYYLQIKDFDNALISIKKGINNLSYHRINIPSEYYFNLVQIYANQNQIDSARIYCNKMLSAAKAENSIHSLISANRYLAYFAEKEGDFKQAYSLKKYSENLKDSLSKNVYNNNILELERKYNNAENRRLLLKAENSKLRAYAITTVILFGLVIIGFPLYKRHKKLKMKCDRLSEAVKHTEWGFLVTKEFITENHIAYDELERMLNREKSLNNINIEFYNRFHEALIQQKANYSGRLFNRLTSFDGTFGAKFQQLFPDFNTDELLMASMIHHQWKTADMTTIFHASAEALRKRRTRLTNKISAKLGREIDLEEFLSNL